MKKCTKCLELKEYDQFYSDKRTKDGCYSRCRVCTNSRYKTGGAKIYTKRNCGKSGKGYYRNYFRTPRGRIEKMWWGMLGRCKYHPRYIEKNAKVIITREEFSDLVEKSNFKELFKEWKESNFSLKLTPTVDRIDNEKGYEVSNIQILTFTENCRKK